MYDCFYEICGLRMHFSSPAPLPQSIFSASPGPADLHIAMVPVDEVPIPDGPPCCPSREHPVWRNGSKISRITHDLFRPRPHCRADYDLQNLRDMTCYVRTEDWTWAVSEKYLWIGMALPAMLLHHRGLILHASYVQTRNQALVFTAPSGTGKSTQAELWRRDRNARVLNGDKAGILLGEKAAACGVPFSGTSNICYNETTPLRALIVLDQGPDNVVQRLGARDAAAALCPNVFVDQAVTEEWTLCLQLLLDLLEQVPVYRLTCTPDERAVSALEQVLF